jgi:hypothetical protein
LPSNYYDFLETADNIRTNDRRRKFPKSFWLFVLPLWGTTCSGVMIVSSDIRGNQYSVERLSLASGDSIDSNPQKSCH